MASDFRLDFNLAQQLGFLQFALGGSRAYEGSNSESSWEHDRDWDFVAVVPTRNEIVSIVAYHSTQLNILLGIVDTEDAQWQNSLKNQNPIDWEVLRFAGWAADGSKRSLKICSLNHLEHIASCKTVCRFGVLSARNVRYCRLYHPNDGHRIFIYQPLRFTENLHVLCDADYLHPDGRPLAVNPGVTLDLLLSSKALYQQVSYPADHILKILIRKWQLLSKEKSVYSMIPLFYGNIHSDRQFIPYLQAKLFPGARVQSPENRDLHAADSGIRSRYSIFSFLPVGLFFWSQQCPPPVSRDFPHVHNGSVEFRRSSQPYRPSVFTSNSSGDLGQIRISGGDWQSVFVKIGREAEFESSILPDVQQYFPPSCAQQLLAKDTLTGRLFFNLHKGQSLNEARLSVETSPTINTNSSNLVEWFLKVELLRAQQVTDAYRVSMNLEPDPSLCEQQKIHRFFYGRLQSDSRFLGFYSQTIRTICEDRVASVSDFIEIPLIINGIPHHSLRHFFDKAREFLNPQEPDRLRDLPTAFGLGDGHGGNVMIIPDGNPTEIMHIDYEVTGFHCPFLDMAKSLYNDGFFNSFYGDLLCDNLTDNPNASGVTVTWAFNSDTILVDYNIDVNDIARVISVTKLEYVLRPVLNRVARHSSSKAKLAEDVLGCALFACALLTRDFSDRPDLFFLNLALGVRLASDMRRVFFDTFDWIMPSVGDGSSVVASTRGDNLLENCSTFFPEGEESTNSKI